MLEFAGRCAKFHQAGYAGKVSCPGGELAQYPNYKEEVTWQKVNLGKPGY
jgi:hypothetical protein